MSTLAEIEAAVTKLPPQPQEALLVFLTAQVGRCKRAPADPVTEVIGAFAGESAPTGREAEEILYGRHRCSDMAGEARLTRAF